MEKLRKWKKGMELKGLRVNIGKTKVYEVSGEIGQAEISEKSILWRVQAGCW